MTPARAHAILTLAVGATFARAVPHPLQTRWDDGRFIIDNEWVHDVSWQSLVTLFTTTHFQAYHPLHLLSYWLDVPWAGAHGPTLHAVNLALWVLAANLLFVAWRALDLSTGAALVAALVFAVHPSQVEVVSWATGRKDVLAALFAFASLVVHVRAKTWNSAAAWWARALFVAAALSKTTTLPWPLVLLLIDVFLRGRSFEAAMRMHAPSLFIAAGLTPLVLGTWHANDMLRTGSAAPGHAVVRVLNTLAHDLRVALWPSSLAPMYSTRAVGEIGVASVVCLGALIVVAIVLGRGRSPRAGFAALGFLALLAPVSNALALTFPWQDRYLSLPLFALAFGGGAALDAVTRAGRGRSTATRAWWIAIALVLALGARTVQYQGVWSSELRLWEHAVRTQPGAYYAWMKLAEVRRERLDFDGAIRAHGHMLKLEPSYKLGYAALCLTVARRDEELRALRPSRAESYARAFFDALDDAETLRTLGARMLGTGHLRTLELPLARAFDLVPFPDAALARAASTHFRAGRTSIGLFYLRRMRTPTREPELLAAAAAAHRAAPDAPVLPFTTRPRGASPGAPHAW